MRSFQESSGSHAGKLYHEEPYIRIFVVFCPKKKRQKFKVILEMLDNGHCCPSERTESESDRDLAYAHSLSTKHDGNLG